MASGQNIDVARCAARAARPCRRLPRPVRHCALPQRTALRGECRPDAARGFTLVELPCDRLRVVRQSKRLAFTLIELLAVISIIALLIALLLPALALAREQAVRIQCAGNTRQIGITWHAYATDHDQLYPASWPGGTWSLLYADLRNYFLTTGIGGDIFYCPNYQAWDWILATGAQTGWDAVSTVRGQTRSHDVVDTAYVYWTNIAVDPNQPEFQANASWAAEYVRRGVTDPWLIRSDLEFSPVPYTGTQEPGNTQVARSPAERRIAWDRITDRFPPGRRPEDVNHFDAAEPAGVNVVYGDGHSRWRRFEDMDRLDMSSGYAQWW